MVQPSSVLDKVNIQPLLKATDAFKKGLEVAQTELERDGVIQRFEFTYEMTWKTLRKILAFKGLDVGTPRDVFREAAKQKLIDDPLVWFEFIRKRNLTVHTYSTESANEIFSGLPLFKQELDKLLRKIKEL